MNDYMVSVGVMDHATGRRIGTAEVCDGDRDAYEAGDHPAFQWPEGIARAADVLSPEDIDRLGIDGQATIWFEV